MTTLAVQKDKRINLRLSSDVKSLISRAAGYCGMSISTFLVSSAADRAKEIVAKNETVTLSPRDWEAFLAVLDDPHRPRPRLEAAAQSYRERHQGDAG